MTIPNNVITVEVLGNSYQIKCVESEVASLQKAALCLDEKMREVRNKTHMLSLDRLAIIAALNLSHELLISEHQKLASEQLLHERLQALQNQLDQALQAEE